MQNPQSKKQIKFIKQKGFKILSKEKAEHIDYPIYQLIIDQMKVEKSIF